MQEGQKVGIIEADGTRHSAVITEVDGVGKSHYKTLAVTYRKAGEDVVLVKVPHENDMVEGEPFWLEAGVSRKKVEEDAPAGDITEEEKEAEEEEEATEAAEILAEQHGVDLADITGTGKDGRIIVADVQKYISEN